MEKQQKSKVIVIISLQDTQIEQKSGLQNLHAVLRTPFHTGGAPQKVPFVRICWILNEQDLQLEVKKLRQY